MNSTSLMQRTLARVTTGSPNHSGALPPSALEALGRARVPSAIVAGPSLRATGTRRAFVSCTRFLRRRCYLRLLADLDAGPLAQS
jgi:hypothetical protein